MPPDENTKGRQKMKLLKLKEVLEITACGKTKLYAMINADEFPRPYKIGAASRWRLDEVENWIKTRPVS
jgi:phage transcriptional regulator, alpA